MEIVDQFYFSQQLVLTNLYDKMLELY